MRLTMKQRQAVTAVTVQRYRQGSKKVKQKNTAEKYWMSFATPPVIVVVIHALSSDRRALNRVGKDNFKFSFGGKSFVKNFLKHPSRIYYRVVLPARP